MTPYRDDVDRAIVDRLQAGVRVCAEPYREAARSVGTTQGDLLARIERLLADRTLTRFGPLFDVERMGGRFVLAAMEVPAQDFERIAGIVNAFPEVAHNYARDHALGMWFVVATESYAAMDDALARIEAATGLAVLAFPKEREYFVGMNLGADAARIAPLADTRSTRRATHVLAAPLDRPIVQALQAGLPRVARPYDEVARRVGTSGERVRARVRAMLADGRIRRIGAVPNHYVLGWRANAMSVWDVDDARVDALGARIGALTEVTHCYRRPRRLPRWPYNLFAMVHGADRGEALDKVSAIAGLLGPSARAHDVLFSTRILKKTGLRLVS